MSGISYPMEAWVKKAYLIGVDLGASGTKAALYRTDGTLVGGPARSPRSIVCWWGGGSSRAEPVEAR
jgi:hypothetical protein